MLKISEFVEFELQYLRDNCNFTEEELKFFDLRAKDITLEEISYKMQISVSKTNTLSRKVKRKIKTVLNNKS